MNMENKKEWFILLPSVFIWRKKDECLFYDSNTFQCKIVYIKNQDVDNFINRLRDIDNLYCIEITKTVNKELLFFLEELIDLKMGAIIHEEEMHGRRPIQLPPLLNLQSEVERLNNKELTDLTVGENILEYIHEIHIILSENPESKTILSVIHFIETLRKSNLYAIKISGDILILNRSVELWKLLNSMHAIKILMLDFKEDTFETLLKIRELNIENFSIFIRINYDFNKELLEKVENFLQSEKIPHEYEFVIANEKDFEEIQTKIQNIILESMNIKPVFNGDNNVFFENNVYLDENDIQASEMTKRNIFAHQVLNTNDFGKLTVTHNGKVYANPHFPPLGTVNDDVRLLVYKEMFTGTSWRRIRDMKPCCDCVYQWLCPSPSSYELEIGKPNLCHVKNDI